MKFPKFFYFCGSFLPPWIRNPNLNPDPLAWLNPDPKHWQKLSGHVGTLFDVSWGGGGGKKKITTSVFLSGQFSKNTTYRTYYTNRTDKEIKSEWYWYHLCLTHFTCIKWKLKACFLLLWNALKFFCYKPLPRAVAVNNFTRFKKYERKMEIRELTL